MNKEAMKLALDALQKIYIAPEHEEYIRVWWPACEQAITALREALAEQPACEHEWLRGGCLKCGQSIEQPAQQWQSTADKCELEKVPANGSLLPAQQEPVAWLIWLHGPTGHFDHKQFAELEFERRNKEYPDPDRKLLPLYTSSPAQRTWVGLTDEEIDQGLLRSDYAFKTAEAWRAGVVFAMTKLKEKNT